MRGWSSINTKKYHVLRIDLSDMKELITSGLVFRKWKDQIDVDQELKELPLQDMLVQIPMHSTVVVIFTGDQVLSRFSSGEPKNLFEEMEEEDFYFQKVEFESGWTMQSACRKSSVDPVLDFIIERKFFLVHQAFDPAVIPILADIMGDVTISSGLYRFQFRDGELVWIMEEHTDSGKGSSDTEFIIEGMSFSKEGVAMLAALLHYLKDEDSADTVFSEHQLQSKFYRRFRRTSVAALSGLFLVLLINFLLYSSIQHNLDRLKSSGENQAQTILEIERLKGQIEEYRYLSLNRNHVPERSYSFYLEELASNRPAGVWFNELSVDPLQSKQEAGKAIETNRSQISLLGETRSPVALNSFISALKDLPWVVDIEMKNYALSGEKERADFELIIRRADEL